MKKIVILGGGTAGTIMANKLDRALSSQEWSITVVDRDNTHYYQPGFLFLPFGIYSPSDVKKTKTEFYPTKVEAIFDEVTQIVGAENKVLLKSGTELFYDILIVSTGCDIEPEETEGLKSDLWQKEVFDFYTFDGATKLGEKLKTWKGGHLVLNVVEMPIKCPVAPLEFLFLADAFFSERGIRDQVKITYATPLPGAFTKPKASKKLGYLLEKKQIHVESEFNIARVDNESKKIVSWDEREIPFDLLVTVPTNMGAQYVEDSEMGDELRFVPTHKHSLQSENFDNIFVIGDATTVPASKAGSVAHFEAEVLFKNVMSYIKGETLTAEFDGHANCFIESGFGKGLLIDFNYDVEPLPGRFPIPGVGPFKLLEESRMNHMGKMAFRWIYWNVLLKGRDMPMVGADLSMSGKATQ